MSMLPRSTPQERRDDIAARMLAAGYRVDRVKHPLIVVGVRGYYRDTMGKVGVNDRGIYDDALFVDSPNAFASFNGNTDPSRVRNKTAKLHGMAVLIPGVYYAHRIGRHRMTWPALRQDAGPVRVQRDGDPIVDIGNFWINIHKGGNTTTSSEGCQTIPPAQWGAFIALVMSEAQRLWPESWKTKVIPYVLLAGN